MPLEEGGALSPHHFSYPSKHLELLRLFQPTKPQPLSFSPLFSSQLPSIPLDTVPILSNWLQYSFSPKICSSTPIRSQHHQNVSGQQALHHRRRPQGQARPYSRMYFLILEAIPSTISPISEPAASLAIKMAGLYPLVPDSSDDYLGSGCYASEHRANLASELLACHSPKKRLTWLSFV